MSDNNGLIDHFENTSYIDFSTSLTSPFKTYIDDSNTPIVRFSQFKLEYDLVNNHLNYYTPLQDSLGVLHTLSDFNNRFELLDLCIENIESQDSWTYRCIAGDLTSKFLTSTQLSRQFTSYFGSTDTDLATSDNRGFVGNLQNFQDTNDYIKLFDPNQSYTLKHDSGTIDYCDQSSVQIKNAIENNRMDSFHVGKSIYRQHRDFNGRFRLVKTASGAFEIPSSGINCNN